MGNHERFFVIIGAVCMFLIILLGSFFLMFDYKLYYFEEYEKTGVYDRISSDYGYDRDGSVGFARNVTDNLFTFFRGGELNYFSDDEKSHMIDVRNIVDFLRMLFYSSIFIMCVTLLFAYRFFGSLKKFLNISYKILLYSGIICSAFLLSILLLLLLAFDQTFWTFHLLFFPQGNFAFPVDTLLITMFNRQFFIDISTRIFLYALAQSILIMIAGWWIKKNLELNNNIK